MKIAVIGGTGDMGFGLTVRLAKTHSVVIGSRDLSRAETAAEKATRVAGARVRGATNEGAARSCEAAILAVPDMPPAGLLSGLASPLRGKLVVSPIVPLKFEDGIATVSLSGESAAERVANALPSSRVASAFQNVPAPVLSQMRRQLDYDVLVTADSREVFEEAAKIVSSVSKLRPLYAGPLRVSRLVEAITPVLLNASRFSKLKSPSIRLV